MSDRRPLYHVHRAGTVEPAAPSAARDRVSSFSVTPLVGRQAGAAHTGFSLCTLGPSGHVEMHLHSNEQSFYVLAGNPQLTTDRRTYRLSPDECGLVAVGVPHAWRNDGDEPAIWLAVNSPTPRLSGSPDTFWTGEPAPASGGDRAPDIRDPRTSTFFRLARSDMDLDHLKIGASVDAPTVSASMATALLAYSGITVKMLVDQRLGAVLHQMFMVEYEPGGVAQPHDHPFEEAYFVLEGEIDAIAEGEKFTLRPGDLFWTGVGSVHAFYNRSGGRVRFLETQSPLPPANHSYRFNRDWEYLSEQLRARS